MEYKGISSSELADSIGVQRSNVTHVLHGRNKPSFQFISKMLETYPEVNAKWLIMGTENMLESSEKKQPLLFSSEEQDNLHKKRKMEEPIADVKPVSPLATFTDTEKPAPATVKTKEVERIVVFFTDQTFKEYGPSK